MMLPIELPIRITIQLEFGNEDEVEYQFISIIRILIRITN